MKKFIDKLPFRAMAEKIPEAARTKVPLLDKVIPFANYIACGLIAILLVAIVSNAGGRPADSSVSQASAVTDQTQEPAASGQARLPRASAQTRSTAAETPESDFTVTLTSDNTGVLIVSYNGNASSVVIPATIQGMPVRIIGEDAFVGRSLEPNRTLTSVVIPEGVTEIQDRAFLSCRNLSSVTLPSTLAALEGRAFFNCISLQSIALPANLSKMGDYIFQDTGLTSFPNPWPVGITRIPHGMFRSTKMRGNLIIPEGITEIGFAAFVGTEISSVTLPSTIREINVESFSRISTLTTVNIPDSVSRILFWDDVFAGSRNINLASQARIRALGYRYDF